MPSTSNPRVVYSIGTEKISIKDDIIRVLKSSGVKGLRLCALSAHVWLRFAVRPTRFQNAFGETRGSGGGEIRLCRVLPVSPQETLTLLHFCDNMLNRRRATPLYTLLPSPSESLKPPNKQTKMKILHLKTPSTIGPSTK